MTMYLFNQTKPKTAGTIEQPTNEEVKSTFGLWNASLDDALRYGGDLTKAAISAMDLKHDRKYVIVDSKIHMLMPNMCPAIPSWHTDGVPRGKDLNPASKGEPRLDAQDVMRSPRFHLLVTGTGCLTDFIRERNVVLDHDEESDEQLYTQLDKQIKRKLADDELHTESIQSCTATEFDWWDLHTGTWADRHEWRYLIRVTETDHIPPQTDLRKVIRTQQNVYVKESFGW